MLISKGVLIVVFNLITSTVFGQDWVEAHKALPTVDEALDDDFGYAIDVFEDYAVIGARRSDEGSLNSGSVSVFQYIDNIWSKTATLTPSDPSPEKQFGSSVAITSEYIVVGAPRDTADGVSSGAIYIFDRPPGGWINASETIKLSASDNEEQYQFGLSLDVEGDYVVVGAPGASLGGPGRAYIYEKPGLTWDLGIPSEFKLVPSDPTNLNGGGDEFGYSIAISGDDIVVGSRKHDAHAVDDGAAYVFTKPALGWEDMEETAKLTAADANNNDNMGASVAIEGNMIVVGAPRSPNGYSNGTAYIFEKAGNDWLDATEDAKLTPSITDNFVGLGNSVLIQDDHIFLGLFQGTHVGIYYYEEPVGGWVDDTETGIIVPENYTNNGNWSSALAGYGEQLFLGDPYFNEFQMASGAARIFIKGENGWGDSEQSQTLSAFTLSSSEDRFGYAVSVSGSIAVIGAPSDDEFGNNAGAAYILTQNGDSWEKIAKIGAPNPQEQANFGHSVDILGNNVIVGAPYKKFDPDSNLPGTPGAAYVYEKPESGWVDTQEGALLSLPEPDGQDRLGFAVTIEDEYAAVSALFTDHSESQGSVYIFSRAESGWNDTIPIAKLNTTAPPKASFGVSIDAFEDEIIVGYNRTRFLLPGAAYIFRKPASGWQDDTETATLTPSDLANGDGFGISVSLTDGYAIVGSAADDDGGTNAGSAYVFKESMTGWVDDHEIAKLTASDPGNYHLFGVSVSMEPEVAVITSLGENFEGEIINGAYLFEKPIGEWATSTETLKLVPSVNDGINYYGFRASHTGANALISDITNNNETGMKSGATYFFHREGPEVEYVSSPTPDGLFGIGNEIVVSVHFSEPVEAVGEINLELAMDTTVAIATLESVDGSTANFEYQVNEGDYSHDLAYSNITSIKTSNGYFKNSADVRASHILPVPGLEHSLQYNKDLHVDGYAPRIEVFDSIPDTTSDFPVQVYFEINEDFIGFEEGDILLNNAEINSFYVVNSHSFGIEITPTHGEVKVIVPENAFTDLAGNPNVSDSLVFEFDYNPMTLLSLDAADSANTAPVVVTARFSTEAIGFDPEDIQLQNAVLHSILQQSPSDFEILLEPNEDGLIKLILNDSIVTNLQEYSNINGDSVSIIYDGTPPSTELTTSLDPITDIVPFDIHLLFSEEVENFGPVDFVVLNGTLQNISQSGELEFDMEVTPANEGVVEIILPEDSYNDPFDNLNVADTLRIIYDTGAQPEGVISTVSDTTNLEPIEFFIDFSEDIWGFEFSDIAITNYSSFELDSIDLASYKLLVTPDSTGLVSVVLHENSATDVVGNLNKGDSVAIYYDGDIPLIELQAEADSTLENQMTVSMFLSEQVVDLNPANIAVTGGGILSIDQTDSVTYSILLSLEEYGWVTMSVPDGSIHDAAGNLNDSTAIQVFFDNIPPNINFSGPEEATNSATIELTVEFDEQVVGFDMADIETTNAEILGFEKQSKTEYLISLKPVSDGVIRVHLPSDVLSDRLGNGNESAIFTITFDSTPPSLEFLHDYNNLTSSKQITLLLGANEAIFGVEKSNLITSNAEVESLTELDTSTFQIKLIPVQDGAISLKVISGSISDRAGNQNSELEFSVTIDTTPPNINLSVDRAEIDMDDYFTLNITFSEDIVGFDKEDFSIINGRIDALNEESMLVYQAQGIALRDGLIEIELDSAIITDLAGNTNQDSESISILVTGLEHVGFDEMIVFPNPASNSLYIQPNNQHIAEIQLLDMTGKLILSKKHRQDQLLDISDLDKGTYLLRVTMDDQGQKTAYTRTIIKN